MGSIQRPPGSQHVGVGQTGVIIADMAGVYALKSGLKRAKVCLGYKDLEFDVFRHLLHQKGQSLIQLELLGVTQRLFPYRGGIVGSPDIL